MASRYSLFTNSDAVKAIQLVISSVGIDTPVTNAKTFTTTALQVGVTYSATATKNGVTKNITLSVMTDHFSYDVNTPFYGGF